MRFRGVAKGTRPGSIYAQITANKWMANFGEGATAKNKKVRKEFNKVL